MIEAQICGWTTETNRQDVLRKASHRPAVQYGFDEHWYNKIKARFPEVEIVCEMRSREFYAYALSTPEPFVVCSVATPLECHKLYDELCRQRWQYEQPGRADRLAVAERIQKAEMDAKRQAAVDKMEPEKGEYLLRKELGIATPQVAMN